MELLAHLADPADPAFSRSWQAIHKLVLHCTGFDGSRRIVRFLPDSDSRIAMALFGVRSPHREHLPDDYGTLLGAVVDAKAIDELDPVMPMLKGIREHVLRTESEFAQSVFEHGVQALVPDATTWAALSKDEPARTRLVSALRDSSARVAVALEIVFRVAGTAGIELSEAQAHGAAADLLLSFPAAVEFYLSVLRKVAQDGYDLRVPKNANSVWDFQLALSASPSTRIDEMPVWVVSSDRPVRAAARDSGASAHFISVLEYRERLRLPFDEFCALATS